MQSIIAVLFTIFFIVPQYGQRLFGTITDSKTNEPIPGVNVFIKSINKGVTTKKDGVFYFEHAGGVEKNDTIIFNTVGYKTLKLTLSQFEYLDKKVQLVEESMPTSQSQKSSGRVITLGRSGEK